MIFFTVTLGSNVIVIDSNDEECEETPDMPSESAIEVAPAPIDGNMSPENASNDPSHEANYSQTSDSSADENGTENMVEISMEQGEMSCEASVSAEQPNRLDNLNGNDCSSDDTPSTSINISDTQFYHAENENQIKKCRLCPYVTHFIANLKAHMRDHADQKKPFPCHKCPKRFTNLLDMERHLKINKHRHRFYCNGCHRGFPFIKQGMAHEEKCPKLRRYECFMGDGFKTCSLSNIEGHMRMHSGEKLYKCQVCHKRYAYLKDLLKHAIVHGPAPR